MSIKQATGAALDALHAAGLGGDGLLAWGNLRSMAQLAETLQNSGAAQSRLHASNTIAHVLHSAQIYYTLQRHALSGPALHVG